MERRVSEDAARQAWRAQRILLQPALHVARQANSEGKAALRVVVDEGVKAFAPILGDALQEQPRRPGARAVDGFR